MSELYDILVETPPTKVILLALDQGLWDCERSLAELSALCEANHMEAVAQVTQKRQTPETGIVLGSGKLEEAAAAAAELGAECAVFDSELTGSPTRCQLRSAPWKVFSKRRPRPPRCAATSWPRRPTPVPKSPVASRPMSCSLRPAIR